MTVPMVGILIVAGLAVLLGCFCMVSELFERRINKKRDEAYDEVPDGYWDELEKYLAERPELPPEPDGEDPEPLI